MSRRTAIGAGLGAVALTAANSLHPSVAFAEDDPPVDPPSEPPVDPPVPPGAFSAAPSIASRPDALEVSWEPVSNADSYTVLTAANIGMTVRLAELTVDGSQRSAVITDLPGRGLGTYSGNTTFVRVRANGVPNSLGEVKVRNSTVSRGRPSAVTPRGTTALTVATYNVLAVQSSGGVHSWTRRRKLVSSTIARFMPDVIALQEASPSNVAISITGYKKKRKRGKKVPKPRRSQVLDIEHLLKARGYRLETKAKANNTKRHKRSLHGGRILYNSKRLKMVRLWKAWLPSTSVASERYAFWAMFEVKATRQRFIFASAHLSPHESAALDALRVRQTRNLLAKIDRTNVWRLPVILGGDLNSTPSSARNGAHDAFMAAGYFDARGAVSQIGTQTKTCPGFASYPGTSESRIDYLLLKGIVGAWEYRNVYSLTPSGTYVQPHASDHNMQLAKVSI